MTRTHLRDTDSARRMEPMTPLPQSRTHVRDTDAIHRDQAIARDREWRASVAKWRELTVSPVTVKVRVSNERLLGLLLADREWTAEEREYVSECERNGR